MREVLIRLIYGAVLVLAAYQVRLGIRDNGLGVFNRSYEVFLQEQQRVIQSFPQDGPKV